MSRKNAAIYRRAAKLIEDGDQDFSCCAIYDAIHGKHASDNACSEKMGNEPLVTRWAGRWGFLGMGDLQDAIEIQPFGERHNCRNLRVLMLCLAAAQEERP